MKKSEPRAEDNFEVKTHVRNKGTCVVRISEDVNSKRAKWQEDCSTDAVCMSVHVWSQKRTIMCTLCKS